MKRQKISSRVRFTVFSRDNFTCQYCGRKAPDVVLQVDHILPVAKGGKNDQGNLRTSCEDCNGGKGARNPSCGALNPCESEHVFIRDLDPMAFYACDPYVTAAFGPICE